LDSCKLIIIIIIIIIESINENVVWAAVQLRTLVNKLNAVRF
jgi:hypothetical protein